MKIIIDDKKFEGCHQYVFWNNKFFKSEDVNDEDLHVHWGDSLRWKMDSGPLPEDFLPESGVIASHLIQLNSLFRKVRRAKGPFNVVLYSRDGGIQNQSEASTRSYRSKEGYCITYNHYADDDHEPLTRIPSSVNKIFCSNVNFSSKRVVCYPYGVMQDVASVIEKAWNSPALEGKRKLCYANFNSHTNRKHRRPIWEKVSQNPHIDRTDNLSLTDYVNDLCSYKYILCPKGNGIDTMRMWESIYCGAIPIVQKSGVSSCFSSLLPIVETDDWNIDKEHLEAMYPAMAYRLSNFGLINQDYWKKIINEL